MLEAQCPSKGYLPPCGLCLPNLGTRAQELCSQHYQGAVSRRVSTALMSPRPKTGYQSVRTIVPCITEAQCPDWVSTASRSLLMVGR